MNSLSQIVDQIVDTTYEKTSMTEKEANKIINDPERSIKCSNCGFIKWDHGGHNASWNGEVYFVYCFVNCYNFRAEES